MRPPRMGVYGKVSYSVAERTREIGIRMAMGVRSGQVLRLIVQESFIPVLAGMLIGVPASAGASRLPAALLFGLRACNKTLSRLTSHTEARCATVSRVGGGAP